MRLNQLVWLSALLASVTARGEDATTADALKTNLEQNLLKPLASRENERSKFSRAAPVPLERRVRVLESALKEDARGLQFATFALDSRWPGGEWSQATVGCIYPKDGAIYVQRGEAYRAAAVLLGKKTENPPETVCRAKSGSS